MKCAVFLGILALMAAYDKKRDYKIAMLLLILALLSPFVPQWFINLL